MSDETTSQLARALTSLREMRARLEAAEGAHHEPIAIIGMGCRLPGAPSPAALWELVRRGGDAVIETPPGRWDAAALFDESPEAAGRVATRWGGFLERIDEFDAAFFGISPREAMQMDPQQRVLLEVAFEALEDAGQTVERLAGSSTGVFVGVHSHSNDYFTMQAADPLGLDLYSGTGTSHSVLSGRLSYLFDLHGPSVAVDTACSSSLVAVHLAVQSLRQRECSLALVGGVNAIIDPTFTMVASRMRMMSPSGRCRPFDAAADGFVRAEGCATVVLKRLSDAVADGDRVLAVIRGSAVNQDGRSNGLTAPNSISQQAVIRAAHVNSGITPQEVGLVEAHGTGTPLGDPIEVEALAEVFTGSGSGTCALGAVKANIGHTEGAAGVAGLVKTVLAVRAGEVPPVVHFQQLSPHISLTGTPFVVPTDVQSWPQTGAPRVAGVSSFGWSGTNAHVVVAEAPPTDRVPAPEAPVLVLPISARSDAARRDLAERYRQLLADSQISGADVCIAAAVDRTHHDHRLAAVGRDRDELIEQLDAFLAGDHHRGLSVGVRESRRQLTAFVFPGQGGQWDGMARRLIESEPSFREAIERCATAMAPHVDWSLLDVFAGTSDRTLDEIDVVQPALFAVQVGLTDMWRARGVEPDAVVGHSMGEVAAAHAAGIVSLDDAARIICRRSRLLRRIAGRGAMAVVELDVEHACLAIGDAGDRLSVAVSNSATSTVLSGDPQALDEVLAVLEASGTFWRRVKVDVASHSPQVDAISADLLAELANVSGRPAIVPMISTVSGTFVDGPELDASYWVANVRQPVRFHEAVQQLIATDHVRFLELSAHPVVQPALGESLDRSGRTGGVVPSLHRDVDDAVAVMSALGALFASGLDIDWRRIHGDARPHVDLPRYPWQRERFWLERPITVVRSERVRDVDGDDEVDLGEVDPRFGGPEDWLYAVEWRSVPRTASATATGTWLVFTDSLGHGSALATGLRACGARCLEVATSEVEAALQSTGSEPFEVVWCRGLDASGDGVQRADELVQLVAAMAAHGQGTLSVVTRGGQRVVDDDRVVSIDQACMWGLGRVIADELPDLWRGLIDLPADVDPSEIADELLAELTTSGNDGDVALRTGGRRFLARLARRSVVRAEPPRFRADSTYLITGGFGAVGQHLAAWLAAHGARRLVLLGRTPLPARADWASLDVHTPAGRRVDVVRRLEALGLTVHTDTVDVGDERALRSFLRQFQHEGWPPVRGVFHAAAVFGGQLIGELDVDALQAQMAPKIVGARVLAEELPDLDHFVLFSSIASVLPMAGQGAYAAANAALDAFAEQRVANGQPAVSINWGYWEGSSEVVAGETGQQRDEGGPTYKDTANALALANGMHGFSTAHGLRLLGQLMSSAPGQTVVVPVDWPAFAAARVARPVPLASEMVATASATSATATETLTQQLARLDIDDRRDLAARAVRRIVGRVLKLPDARIDDRQPFGSMGLDSLMGIELRNGLEIEFGQQLPATVAWNYPSVDELTGHLLDRLGFAGVDIVAASPAASRPSRDTDGRRIAESIAGLSDDDALAALMGGADR